MSATEKLIRIHDITKHPIIDPTPEATLMRIRNIIGREAIASEHECFGVSVVHAQAAALSVEK